MDKKRKEFVSGNCNLLYGYHALAPRKGYRVERVTIKVIIILFIFTNNYLPIDLIHSLAKLGDVTH